MHAESSGTLSEVVQALFTHCAMSAVPWQAEGTSQEGAVEYAAGQSLSLAQQSPAVQQKPFWQCPERQLSEPCGQVVPLSRSPRQVCVVGSQNALSSQSLFELQLVGQVGGAWFAAPVQWMAR